MLLRGDLGLKGGKRRSQDRVYLETLNQRLAISVQNECIENKLLPSKASKVKNTSTN